MTHGRTAYRVDSNQAEIVAALRGIGASVTVIAGVGGGCPDLLVGYRGVNFLMEVKANSHATFTEDEYRWRAEWFGNVFIVTTPEEAIDIVRTNPHEMQY